MYLPCVSYLITKQIRETAHNTWSTTPSFNKNSLTYFLSQLKRNYISSQQKLLYTLHIHSKIQTCFKIKYSVQTFVFQKGLYIFFSLTHYDYFEEVSAWHMPGMYKNIKPKPRKAFPPGNASPSGFIVQRPRCHQKEKSRGSLWNFPTVLLSSPF